MIGKNNVLNIRNSSSFQWLGQSGSTRGFADFESVEMCRRAGLYLLMRSYRRAGVITLAEVIHRWAPVNENPTAEYIHYVATTTKIKPQFSLTFDADFANVLAAMEIFEQGIAYSEREQYYISAQVAYMNIINKFNLKKA